MQDHPRVKFFKRVRREASSRALACGRRPARNRAFLDTPGHQANDFQVNNASWQHLNELTAEYQQDGRFVTFPGYE